MPQTLLLEQEIELSTLAFSAVLFYDFKILELVAFKFLKVGVDLGSPDFYFIKCN